MPNLTINAVLTDRQYAGLQFAWTATKDRIKAENTKRAGRGMLPIFEPTFAEFTRSIVLRTSDSFAEQSDAATVEQIKPVWLAATPEKRIAARAELEKLAVAPEAPAEP